MSSVAANHIHLDERGVAWIDDTNVKVIEVALDHVAYGMSPHEIVYQHYGQCTLGQVHAALSYYFDYQVEFDALIEQQAAETDKLRSQTLDSPARRRLREAG